MPQSYLKNAALLTVSDVLLRLAGMGLRIYLANALGGEGMGLYQLVLAVYGLFVTLATAGISVAATRLMVEELDRSPGAARGMLARLAAAGVGLGTLAMAGQLALAGLAARWWLGDLRAAPALRAAAFGMPFMAFSAVARGFFVARRKVVPNLLSQLGEQTFRIGGILWMLEGAAGLDPAARCTRVLAVTAASEAVSAMAMALFCRAEARRCFGRCAPVRPPASGRRIWAILWPVEGGRCLASGLHMAENMLVPACLTVYLAAAGGRSAAVEQYGVLKGMALPLLSFPFGLLGSLSVLLMPEVTQAHIRGQKERLARLLERMLRLTAFFSVLTGAVFWVWGQALTEALYGSAEAGFYIQVLAPAMPLLYLENMVDGALKGMGEQRAIFYYSMWDSVLRIAGVALLLPRFGTKGLLFVTFISALYSCGANTRRLLERAGIGRAALGWLAGPAAAAAAAVFAGWGLHSALAQLAAGTRGAQLAAAALGSAGMAAVYFAAAWPLGLNRQLKGLRRTKEADKTAA